MKTRRAVTVADIIITAAVIAVAVFLLFAPRGAGGKLTAEVYYEGKLVYVAELGEQKEPSVYEVNGVTVEFSPDGARVVDSPCPDRICVETGLLARPGDTAACVPRRVIVRIVGIPEVDAVS